MISWRQKFTAKNWKTSSALWQYVYKENRRMLSEYSSAKQLIVTSRRTIKNERTDEATVGYTNNLARSNSVRSRDTSRAEL